MAIGAVTDTGLSVVYEPDEPSSAIVDIVFVHGLQGHPRGTWTKGKVRVPKGPLQARSLSEYGALDLLEEGKVKRGSLAWISKKLKRKSLANGEAGTIDRRVDSQESSGQAVIASLDSSSRNTTNVSAATSSGRDGGVFWPADLLPKACPRARILVFGYDTRITNYGAAPTNKNSIYSHAKDLVFALSRETEGCLGPAGKQRQIIFVAHSLGGIVVKEMLSRSSASTEPQHARIVESTAGVVFLGTPHRGSPDFAAAGDWARTFVSFFGAETSPAMLHALGLRTTDLERAQESFSGLWLKHNFRVKTFQEGLGLTGINIGALGGKVVPDYSSSLGDQREHAETIQANHREMCRFYGADDPGYRQVSGELLSIYSTAEKDFGTVASLPRAYPPLSIASSVSNRKASAKSSLPFSVNSIDLWGVDKTPFSETEKAFLSSLWYPNMKSRMKMITTPADGTCDWLFQNPVYKRWIEGENQAAHHGLLQIKGTPGSGKSVLLKEAYRRALQNHARSHCCIAAFFFYGNGSKLEKSKEGLLRSLLYQLLPQDREYLAQVVKEFTAWSNGIVNKAPGAEEKDNVAFPVEQLERNLRSFLTKSSRQHPARRTLIFIDALDECLTLEDRMALSYFLGATGAKATRSKCHLGILMSNRHFPFLTVGSRPAKLDINQLNRGDINSYIEQRLTLGTTAADCERSQLLNAILEKARGVFLWVVLAVDGLIARWQQGESLRQLLRHLDDLPQELQLVYQQLLDSVPRDSKAITLRIFQWAVLPTRPLQLREWHDLMAFIGSATVPKSLKESQDSDGFTATDDQLERKLRALSKGLLEVAVDTDEPEDNNMAMSVSQFAGAGSFMMNPGETRIIQVIHETVNEYFRSGGVFEQLCGSPEMAGAKKPLILGHLSIMRTCLDYLQISELDALVDARIKAAKRERVKAVWTSSKTRPRLEQDTTIELDDLLFDEDEYESPIGPEGLEILRWLAGIHVSPPDESNTRVGHQDIHRSAVRRNSHRSDYSFRTQRLEAYPALMQYATDEFFTHAGYCLDHWDYDSDVRETIKSGMEPMMKLLFDKAFSRRWLALREELHVLYPADESRPLTFITYLLNMDYRFGFVFPGKQIPPAPPALPPTPPPPEPFSGREYKASVAFRQSITQEYSQEERKKHHSAPDLDGDDDDESESSFTSSVDADEQRQSRRPHVRAYPTPNDYSTPKDRENTSTRGRRITRQPSGARSLRREESVGSFRSAATSAGSRHSRHSRHSRR